MHATVSTTKTERWNYKRLVHYRFALGCVTQALRISHPYVELFFGGQALIQEAASTVESRAFAAQIQLPSARHSSR